jgi:hypothetical protein
VATASDAATALDLAPAAKKAKPKLTTDIIGSVQFQGLTTSTVYATVTVKGKAAAGKIQVAEGKKTLKTAKLKKGAALVKLPKNLKIGTHKLKVTYLPASPTKTASAKKSLTMMITKATAEQSATVASQYCKVIRKQVLNFAPTLIAMGADANATISKAEATKSGKAFSAIAAAAPTPEAQEGWATFGDMIRFMGGVLSIEELAARHPGAFESEDYLDSLLPLIENDGTACGAV